MTTSFSEQRTADDAWPQQGSYRSISAGAIGVLILSLFSPLSLLSPVMWFVPVATILAAIWVLRSLAINADRLTGGLLAVIGLSIGLLFLGVAPARYAFRMRTLHTEARQVADAWVKLVNQRDLQQAHQWHLLSAERAAPGTTLNAFYAENAEQQKAMQTYFESNGLAHWLAVENPQTTYKGIVKQNSFSDAEEFFLHYNLTGTIQGKPTEFPIYVVVVRREVAPQEFEMTIGHVLDFDPVPIDDN